MEPNFKTLEAKNYVRVSKPDANYWLDYSKKKLEGYKEKFGDNFNIITYSKQTLQDYYIIPFKVIKHLFLVNNLTKYKDPKKSDKWIFEIKNHILYLTNNRATGVDVKDHYRNPFLQTVYVDDDQNDYEIENKKQEIFVRLKQSVFRKKVLENFNYTCCISNLTEKNLLVASHIVPWANNKQVRLDPSNGLCLSALYDKLFDLGYFTLTDDLEVQIFAKGELSEPLKDILEHINTHKINRPNQPIKPEYLKYHRENVFLGKLQKIIQ